MSNNFTRHVVSHLSRHFVTLSCEQTLPGEEGRTTSVASGFIIEILGEWFYLTAGHILRRVKQAIDAGSAFDIWRFGDPESRAGAIGTSVPYGFAVSDWYVLDDESLGFDYAVMHLSELYRRQLEAGGTVAIGYKAWGNHVQNPSQWALVGIPSESVSKAGPSRINGRLVFAMLEACPPPPLAGQRAENQFYAAITGEVSVFNDADGLSGSPVFTIYKFEEEWRYKIVGVQSAWYQTSRVLAICPIESFATSLRESLAEARLAGG